MDVDTNEGNILICSFCEKTQNQVKKLIAGPDCYICDECIDLCYDIIHQESVQGEHPSALLDKGVVPSPKMIKEFLDQYVIGQDYSKMVVSVAVHNHYKRLQNPIVDGVELEKSNILMMGPTGCGKTLIAQTIARMLNVPCHIADATTLTEAGYVGDDVESILTSLIQKADGNVELAQKGIIFIDEIDKKGSKSDSASITRDVSGEGVQQALLKMIEGTVAHVPVSGTRKHPQAETIEIDTKNILFIVSGAFVGLDKIVRNRIDSSHSSAGFGAKLKNTLEQQDVFETLLQIEPEDLKFFGLIPELIGRLHITAPVSELSEEQLIKVLTEPKNAIIKQFKALFKLEDIELEFTESGLQEIAKLAQKRKTGARGLRSIVEKRLLKIQYELLDLKESNVEKITIDENVILNNLDPIKVFKTESESNVHENT